MTGTTTGIAMFAGMLVLMAARTPIAASMFIPGAIGYWVMTDEMTLLNFLKGSAVARLTVYDLSVIPLFLLMGQFATKGGLSQSLFRAAAAFIGHIRGGLGMASIMAAAGFGAVCGSSVATTATIAQVSYPEMKAHGYAGRLSTGLLATGGSMGILIPPSVPLVVYAILTEQNIAKLFAAAFIPGILAALGYIVVIAVYCRLRPEFATATKPIPWAKRWAALVDVWPIAVIFTITFGGIYGGAFTPTEGAAVGAVGVFIVGVVKRELTREAIAQSMLGAAETSAMVFMIFLAAEMMNSALALTLLPAHLAEWVAHLDVPPLAIIAAILAVFVILCAVMDELSLVLLTIPVLFPSVVGLDLWGLDPQEKAIWFGVLILMVVQIGLIMPPVGLNVYVVNSVCKGVPMGETYKGVLPFLISDFMRVALLLFVPSVSLGLVRWLFP